MPIIAPCSSSPSLDGRGRSRAVLCIVIRESPLSPFLPIFKCRDLQLDFLLSSVAHCPPFLPPTLQGLPRLLQSSIFPFSTKPLRNEYRRKASIIDCFSVGAHQEFSVRRRK